MAEPSAGRSLLSDAALLLLGATVLPIGIWLTLTGAAHADRWIGIAALLASIAAAVYPMIRLHRRWPRAAPYLPIAAALFEAPWLVAMLLFVLFLVGDMPFRPTRSQEEVVSAYCVLPAALGLLWSGVGVARDAQRGFVARLCCIGGGLVCVMLMAWLLWDVVHPVDAAR